MHNAPQVDRRRGLRALQILSAVEEDVQEPRGGGRTSLQACSRISSSRGGDSEPVCGLKRRYQISAPDLQFLVLRNSTCRWMSALVVLGELRAVGTFVTHVAGLHRALPSIAALRAAGRVLRRAILSEKAVGTADSMHKTVCSTPSRRTQKYCAPRS